MTDSVTSDGLTKFIEARGGKHLRYAKPAPWLCTIQHAQHTLRANLDILLVAQHARHLSLNLQEVQHC